MTQARSSRRSLLLERSRFRGDRERSILTGTRINRKRFQIFSSPNAAASTIFSALAIPRFLRGRGSGGNLRLNRSMEGNRRYLARLKRFELSLFSGGPRRVKSGHVGASITEAQERQKFLVVLASTQCDRTLSNLGSAKTAFLRKAQPRWYKCWYNDWGQSPFPG